MKSKVYLLFSLAFFFSACATGSQSAALYESQRGDIQRRHADAMIYSNSVADAMTALEFKKQFATEICEVKGDIKRAPKKVREACGNKWEQAFVAKLVERYTYADRESVTLKCKANPIQCKDPNTLENWARESHNSNVQKSESEKLAALNSWYAGAHAQEQQQRAAALQEYGNSMTNLSNQLQQQSRAPTMQPMQPMQQQQCNTRPDGFGGWRTECY